MSYLLRLIVALPIVLSISCKQAILSDNETKATKEIVDLYGGVCTYSFGTNLSTDKGKQSFFEIEMSEWPIDETAKWTEMYASNFAYIFYTHTKNDKRQYHKIKSAIVYKGGAKFQFEYSPDSLKIVSAKMDFATEIVNTLKRKDYQKIDQLLAEDVVISIQQKKKYLDRIKRADSTLGAIESFTPTGFKFRKMTNGDPYLHISGNLKRSIKDSQFSVDIHPGEKNELYLFAYDY